MTSRKTRWIIRLEFPRMNDELMTSRLEKVFSHPLVVSSPRSQYVSPRWRILCSTIWRKLAVSPERTSIGLINSDRRNEKLENHRYHFYEFFLILLPSFPSKIEGKVIIVFCEWYNWFVYNFLFFFLEKILRILNFF